MRIPSRYAFDKYLFSKFDDRVCRYIFFWLYDTRSVAGNLFRQIINERYNINLINEPKKDALATVDSNIAVNNRVSSKKFMFDSIGHTVLCVNDTAHMGEKFVKNQSIFNKSIGTSAASSSNAVLVVCSHNIAPLWRMDLYFLPAFR
jgi:hypothetical protein